MAKRSARRQQAAPVKAAAAPVKAEERRYSPLLWLMAAALAAAGFMALLKADPRGENPWSFLAPALLLAGYLLFIPALTGCRR